MYLSILTFLLRSAAAAETLEVTVPSFPSVVVVATGSALPLEEWRQKTFTSVTVTLETPHVFEAVAETEELRKLAEANKLGLEQAGKYGLNYFTLTPTEEKANPLTGASVTAILQTLKLQLLPSEAERTVMVVARTAGGDLTASIDLKVTVEPPRQWEMYGVPMADGRSTAAIGAAIGAMPDVPAAVGDVKEIAFTALNPFEGDSLDQGATSTSSAGRPLGEALSNLRTAEATLGPNRSARSFAVRATINAGNGPAPYDIARVDVYPELPSVPASCFVVAPYRSGKGLTLLQGPKRSKVARAADVVAGAVVRAKYREAGKDRAYCPAHRAQLDNHALRLSLTARPVDARERLEPCTSTPDKPNGCAAGNAVQSPLTDHKKGASVEYPFLSAWKRFADEPDANLSDGMNVLYAHVEIVTLDGSNARPIVSNVPVSLLVDSDPVQSFEVVTHPAATNVAVLQCRDVLGDSSAENDGSAAAERCMDMPGGPVLSESVSVIPIGLHYRWSPFYRRQWLGFGADVGFLSLGTSGFITGASAAPTGLNALASGMVGLDLQANGNDSVATRLNFLVGGGVTLLQGQDGTYARPYFGLTITTPILLAKESATVAASPTSAPPISP